jgi:succinoglycan biosynthesis transport protein ExoP
MDLKDIIAIAWRRRLTIVLVLVAAIVASAGIAFTRTKQYQSTETLVMTPNTKFQAGQVGANSLQTLLPTYGAIAQASTTKNGGAALLGHPLHATITSSTTAGTGILKIIATSPSPTAALQAAQAVSNAFDAAIGTKEVLISQVVGAATLPTAPVSPRKSLIIGAGVILGLALGFALALVLDRWFDRVSTAAEVTAATGLTCLGLVPRSNALRGGGPNSLMWEDDPEYFRLQEAMRALRTTLQLSMDGEHEVIQVTSPSPGDGKSTVAANLAIAIGSLGIPTTLIDADFWAPRQHLIFSLSNARGLSTLMAGDRDEPRPPLQRTKYLDLRVLTSGPLPSNPTEMIAANIESVLDRVRKVGRVIVIDTPPVLAISDARLIAAQADSVLVVAKAGHTKSAVLKFAVEQLQLAQSHITGVVLNGVQKLPSDQVPSGGYYMRPGQDSLGVVGSPASTGGKVEPRGVLNRGAKGAAPRART